MYLATFCSEGRSEGNFPLMRGKQYSDKGPTSQTIRTVAELCPNRNRTEDEP